jgi:hypothetical protein
MHLDYGDVTPLFSLWHFIKHSTRMLLAMAPPPPPHPRAMVVAALVPPRTTQPQGRSAPGHRATHGRNRGGAPPVAVVAVASMGSGSSALGRRCCDRELVPATAASMGSGGASPVAIADAASMGSGSSALGPTTARGGELRPWPPPPPRAWARGGLRPRPPPPHAGRDSPQPPLLP